MLGVSETEAKEAPLILWIQASIFLPHCPASPHPLSTRGGSLKDHRRDCQARRLYNTSISSDRFSILLVKKKKKQATRKRLGMHVLLIEVEERNSEGMIPSILVKERESRGRNSRPSKRWTKNSPSSSERGDICMESRGCNKSEEKSLLNSNGRYECWRNDNRWPPSFLAMKTALQKHILHAEEKRMKDKDIANIEVSKKLQVAKSRSLRKQRCNSKVYTPQRVDERQRYPSMMTRGWGRPTFFPPTTKYFNFFYPLKKGIGPYLTQTQECMFNYVIHALKNKNTQS
jgi:hypothetical protein